MNPFITRGYAGAEYFCDREKETHDIVNLLSNGNNIALISPRRLGKTDLIRHCFAQSELKEKYYTFLIDIYATSSLRDFVNTLGKAILDELKPRGKKTWEKFIMRIRQSLSMRFLAISSMPTNPVLLPLMSFSKSPVTHKARMWKQHCAHTFSVAIMPCFFLAAAVGT